MKKKKVIISLFTSMLLVMQLCINPIVTYADVNNENEESTNNDEGIGQKETKVKNIYFNKNEINVGDTLKIFAEIENVPEGNKVYAQLWFPQNPLYYELNYNEELGLYTADIKIEEAFRYKTLNFIGIDIRSENESSMQYQSGLSVTVADENGVIDKGKPLINSVKINKNEISVGEKLEVLVDATDDVSGISEVKSSVYVNGEYKELKFSYDEVDKVYKSYFEITEDLKYKTIRVTIVTVTDKADKSTSSSDWINVSVLDEKGNKDDIKPVIKSIEFDKEYYNAGDTLKLYVDAYDDESGIQFIEAYVKVGRYTKRLALEYNEELKKYVDEFHIDEDVIGSKITLANLIVADNAYNYADFDQEVSAYVLTKDGQLDKEAPIVNSIEYSKDKLNLQDKLEITLDAADDISGISNINAKLNIGEKSFTYSFSKYDASDNKYILVINTEDYMYFKDLNIEYIEAIDYAGNLNKIKVNKNIPVTDESKIINDNTDIQRVIEEIKASKDNEIKILIKNKEKIVDKDIFKAIAGTDKIISFVQEDGTVWTFKGKDIKNENLASIKLSVSNVPTEEAKNEILKLTDDGIFIKFDHHGNLPGKASIRIKVNNKELVGKKLAFYYYNPETKEVEKVSDNIVVDEDGYAIIEIDHCSDYFLSANSNLLGTEESENNQGQAPSDNNLGENPNGNNGSNNQNEVKTYNKTKELPETGGSNPAYSIITAISLLGIGSILTVRNKKKI